MSADPVLSEKLTPEITLITLNRPDKLNAWTPTMADEQAHAIAAANASIGVVRRARFKSVASLSGSGELLGEGAAVTVADKAMVARRSLMSFIRTEATRNLGIGKPGAIGYSRQRLAQHANS
mgnify:CR=1 FL=1